MRKSYFRTIYLTLQIFALSCLFSTLDATHYKFLNEPIDVVIPAVEKDIPTLNLCVESIRKYGEGVRRVIVVSKDRLTDQAEWFDEKKFPFDQDSVAYQICDKDLKKSFRV